MDSGPYVCDEKGEPLEYCFSIKNESHLEEILEDYDSMYVAANLEIIQRLVTDKFTFKEQPKNWRLILAIEELKTVKLIGI